MNRPTPDTGPVGPACRRSCLSVPAGDERKMAKALASTADEVVFDLEDSVAAESKPDARRLLVGVLSRQPRHTWRRIAVRVNPVRSPWCHEDITALAGLPDLPGSIVLPKVDGPGDLAFVDRLLDGVEASCARPRRLGVQALVETPCGLARVGEIAGAGERLEALVLGYADLGASLGMTAPSERRLDLWLPAQQALLVAARTHGLQAVDGPHLGVAVDAPFERALERARDLGFDGKWAIHPRQLDPVNAAFTPSPDEVAHAREVLAALGRAREQGGAGVALLHGQMLDEAVALAARRLLSRLPAEQAR